MSGSRGSRQKPRQQPSHQAIGKANSIVDGNGLASDRNQASPPQSRKALSWPFAKCSKNNTEKHNSYREKKHPLDYWVFIFVILTTAATIAAAIFTRNQWLVAADSEERQLRAYVHFAPGDLYASNETDGSWVITISPKISVIGQTPAGSVFIPWDVRAVAADKAGSFQVPTDYVTSGRSRIDVFPGQDRSLGAKSINITSEDVALLSRGKKIIFFIGTAAYRDVFDKLRWTNFCYTLNWNQIESRQPQACDLHNDADWDANPQSEMKTIRIPME